MGAVRLVVRAELRHRWRSWLALALLVAVVGGLVLAAGAAGRRTAAAFPDYAATYGYDSFVYAPTPVPKLTALPEVASAVQVSLPANGIPTCACTHQLNVNDFAVYEVPVASRSRFAKLVAGHWPDQSDPDQVTASFTLESKFGVRIGSVLHVPFFTAAQAQDPAPPPNPGGPMMALRVVGIDATESDFPSVGMQSYGIITTRAFDRAVNPQTGLSAAYAVRLRHGAADLPRFDSEAQAFGTQTGQQEATPTITSAIHPQALGWWLLAALAALAGLATVAQALSRQAVVESETYRILASFGLGPGKLVAVGMTRALVIGTAGALGASGLAFALSPLAPLGEARVAEPTTGFQFDPVVLGLGALAIVVVVLALNVWPALRVRRHGQGRDEVTSGRTSPVAARLAGTGAPPSIVIGVRRALERGRGRSAVPVGSALAGTVLAVTALCGTVVFGSSLTHLTTTPRLYGQSFDVWFNTFNPGRSSIDPVLAKVQADPAVTGITLGTSGSVSVNGIATDAIAGQPLRGKLLISSVNGRVPAAPDEIALGVATMHRARAHVGSVVRVTVNVPSGGVHNSDFRVVGTASFPPDFGVVGLNNGAIFSVAGYVDSQCPSGRAGAKCRASAAQSLSYVLLVGVKSGAAGRAAVTHLVRAFPAFAILPATPTNLVNFGEAVNFPLILGVVLVLFGAATLVHVLVVSVARRRRELGLLKALGFVRHQTVAAVCWQATTIAVIGVVLGVPLGVAAGHEAWRAFATNLGVVPDPLVPTLLIAALAIGVLVMANVLALAPALVSARQRASVLLRSE